MNVLHLPTNVASQISTTVRALRDIGVEARGLAATEVVAESESIKILPNAKPEFSLRAIQNIGVHSARVARAILWADVVHWYYNSTAMGLDIRLSRILRRKGIVEFWGSDIRIPEIEAADNPYYAKYMSKLEYRDHECLASSHRRQRAFARHGINVLVPCRSLVPYLRQDLFTSVHHIRQRVYLPDYHPTYSEERARPLVVHSPTAPVAKGTATVERAVESLQPKLQFEYRRVMGVPHAEALQIMRQCDIYVDQLVIGSHGLAAVEAMAFGKPVVCYIKPSMVNQYPSDLPIVNATMETLEAKLAQLIEDHALRKELGQRGRAYVKKHHDAHTLARELTKIYQERSLPNTPSAAER